MIDLHRSPISAAFALGSDAAQRMEDAIRVIDAFLVVVGLGAQPTLSEGMRGVAQHGHDAAVADLEEHRTGVRTVVRTRAQHGAGFRWRSGL
jgi:hypothetical protein